MKKLLLAFLLATPICAYADNAKVAGNADEMLKHCDKNNDGKLSKDEYTESKMEKFAEFDGNSDGFLDKAENQKMAKEIHDKLMS